MMIMISSTLIFQSVYYYDTFSNGSEWAYWDTATSQYIYYNSNGSVGSGTLKDWLGNLSWQKNLTIEPIDNPPVSYVFGSAAVNMTTGSDIQPWPGGDINTYILNLHNFGLYSLQFTFGNTTTTVPRIIGDTLRGTKGVYGAILNAVSGQLYIDHENFPQEAPLTVTNGVFYGKRSWTSIPDSNTGGTDSKPGRVYIKYIEDGGKVYYDRRNIDLGSYAGNQLFLFDTKSMKLIDSSLSVVAEVSVARRALELSQNFPNPFNPTTIINYQLPVNSFVTLKIYDILGREVAVLINGLRNAGYYSVIFNGTNLSSGVYFYRLQAGAYSETKKLLLLK